MVCLGKVPLLCLFAAASAAAAVEELYFDKQCVDHYAATAAGEWRQRYFRSGKNFRGPGYPILLIIAGEGSMGDEARMFYPWVENELAERFGALVVQPEHRFFGPSHPVAKDQAGQWARLLTPQQALEDLVRFTSFVKKAENCTGDRFTKSYCPVILIGGSYPGFLSMAGRLRFPAVFDGAYSASAPVTLYAQQVDHAAYYEVVTRTAEEAVPGCAAGVRSAFAAVYDRVGPSTGVHDLAQFLGVCDGSGLFLQSGEPQLPEYMRHDVKTFLDEISMVISFTFASLNMGYYPPSPSNPLVRVCNSFVDAGRGEGKLIAALRRVLESAVSSRLAKKKAKPGTRHVEIELAEEGLAASAPPCIDLSALLLAGQNPTITCGDWSGCGPDSDGESWDLQTSTLLVERISTTNVTDMFPPRNFTLEWLQTHASSRFGAGAQPRPSELKEAWGFTPQLLASTWASTGASKIFFTNGLRDGWSAGAILADLAPEKDLLVFNMPNGAHHSDLSHLPPSESDTDDVNAARVFGGDLMAKWIREAGPPSTVRDVPNVMLYQ